MKIKKVAVLVGVGAVLALSSNAAFALGRGHKSGHRGFNQSTNSGSVNNGGGSITNDNQNVDNGGETPRDSNPVPEPASLVLFGSALAGLGGYKGLRSRFARRSK